MIRRPEMLNRRAKPSALLIVMSAVLIVFAVIVLLDCLRGIFMFTVEIKGSSMLNTFYGGVSAGGDYEGGDIVYALRSFSAERGDVVIIDTTASDAYVGNDGTVFTSGTIIKRLIAVEGDSVKCERGVVPEWAIAIKDFTTGWERFRASLGALFS